MRNKTHKSSKLKFLIKTFKVGVCVGALLTLWLVTSNFLLARKLECFTQFGQCPPEVTMKIHWLVNLPLLKPLPISKVEHDLKDYLDFRGIQLFRRLPDTLIVSIELRQPVGSVGTKVLGAYALADSDGQILRKYNPNNFPILMLESRLNPGDRLSPEQKKALKILETYSSLSVGRLVGQIDQGSLSVYFPENIIVKFDLNNSISNWYNTLQVILDRSKMQSVMPKVVDFRFKNPIVTF
jgi:hypothetical protein